MMKGQKIYTGTPEQFANWVKDCIAEISKQCGWADVVSMTNVPLVLNDYEEKVVSHTIIHADETKTYLMCDVANNGMPFSACLSAFIAMDAIQTCERYDGRVVVVSPIVDEKIVKAVRSKSAPINFLMANVANFKYWNYAKGLPSEQNLPKREKT